MNAPVASSLTTNTESHHQKKTSHDSVTESGNAKPKSKLAKMILNVLDDEVLPTADEAEKQKEQALAYALQLKAENEKK